jgi:hypothetical protein
MNRNSVNSKNREKMKLPSIILIAFLFVPAYAAEPQPTLHFKYIQRQESAMIILADSKTNSYSLACKWKGDDDRNTKLICQNFRSGHDYVPAMRMGDSFLFDDPEGTKDDKGNPYAVTMNIASESEKEDKI